MTQCWEVRIHFEITCGEQPFPIKNNKSLKVSLSPIGFFQKILYVLTPDSNWIKCVSVEKVEDVAEISAV